MPHWNLATECDYFFCRVRTTVPPGGDVIYEWPQSTNSKSIAGNIAQKMHSYNYFVKLASKLIRKMFVVHFVYILAVVVLHQIRDKILPYVII